MLKFKQVICISHQGAADAKSHPPLPLTVFFLPSKKEQRERAWRNVTPQVVLFPRVLMVFLMIPFQYLGRTLSIYIANFQ